MMMIDDDDDQDDDDGDDDDDDQTRVFLESEKVGAVGQDKQNAHVDSALRAFYSLSSSSLSLSVSSKCGHGSNLPLKMSMR